MKRKVFIILIFLIVVALTLGFVVQDKPLPVEEGGIDYTQEMFIKKIDEEPFEYSMSFYGIQEKLSDGRSNPIVLSMYEKFSGNWKITDSSVAWCSAMINSVFASCGYEYSGKLNARSWLDVGERVYDPKPGDVVVFWRESVESWKGHVAMYVRETDDLVYVYGGNQSNGANIRAYPKYRLLQYRRMRKLSDLYPSNEAFMTQDSVIRLKLEV